jgi:hypothetical protein
LPTRSIDHNKVPGNRVYNRGDRESDSERMLLMNNHSKETRDPLNQNAPRSTSGGTKFKIIKSIESEFFQKMNINKLSFGFLETKNICPTLFNFISQQAPVVLII